MTEERPFDCCAFCPTERRDLYKCPKCARFYCSARCYKSCSHLQCSERFYRAQCEQMEGGPPADEGQTPTSNEPQRPKTTFEEYMKKHQPAAGKSDAEVNPQIEVNPNEEVVFDSDDEPDYLMDVARESADQFEKLDMDELDRRLLAAGISPGIGTSTSLCRVVEKSASRYVVDNICGELDVPTKRLFAVVYLQRKQFKISQDDIIHIEHNFPADVGDRIKLDKVLMVGGENFSVIGRPLLNPDFATVYCTVIEKNYTQPDVMYNFLTNDPNNVRWGSHELTVLRVNNIQLDKEVFTAPAPPTTGEQAKS